MRKIENDTMVSVRLPKTLIDESKTKGEMHGVRGLSATIRLALKKLRTPKK